jgi:hypothetical protein
MAWALKKLRRDGDRPAELLETHPGRGELLKASLNVRERILRLSLFRGLDCRFDPCAVGRVCAEDRELEDEPAIALLKVAGVAAFLGVWKEPVVDFPGPPLPSLVVAVET